LGTVGAKLSFAERSETYPIGLKQAYFEFYLAGPGLPLGPSGLFLNGIRGGFAFGPPDEVPAALKQYFGQRGARLQLGLRVVDSTVGKLFVADGDVWVDVYDWDWAFSLDMTVLKGTFNLNATVLAALSKNYGLYAGMSFRIVFARGKVEFYVFSQNGRSKFSGQGSVQFGLFKGFIFHTEWEFLGHHEINIPDQDFWLPSIGAEFGDFTNGQRGFKGFVDAPILGQVGVFIGSASGSVSHLSILGPSGIQSSSVYSRSASTAGPSILSADRRDLPDDANGRYRFTVPARHGAAGAPSGDGCGGKSRL
jgi:hypothetical protein